MERKITFEMVVDLNERLAILGCPFRYKYDEQGCLGNPEIHITLLSTTMVQSFIVNPTEEFFDWLEAWFKTKGIELGCNNDRSIMWSKNGWDTE